MKGTSPRFHFILVVIITLFLLVGSTILQQLVFKADQETATLVLSPATFRTTEGTVLDIDIQNASADTVFATGLQVEVEVDADKLELIEALPKVGWRTLVLQQTPGKIHWLIAPTAAETTIAEVSDQTSFGRVRFKALTAGTTSLTLNEQATILAAVDPAQGNFVYNAAVGVQSSSGTISSISELNLDFPETAVTTLTAPETNREPIFGAQRITSTYAAATTRDALIFITLAFPGRASVEFGTTPQFGNIVESVNENISHVIRLASLESERQYYYRVIGERAGEQSRVVGVTRSITLPAVSATNKLSAEDSEVIAFPNKTDRLASVYAFPRDASGAAVTDTSITLTPPAGVVAAAPKKQAGYWQFDVTSTGAKKEVVAFRPSLGDGTLLASASIVFDPNYSPAKRTASVQELVLEWNQRTMVFMLGAAFILFLLGFLFVRLVRSR